MSCEVCLWFNREIKTFGQLPLGEYFMLVGDDNKVNAAEILVKYSSNSAKTDNCTNAVKITNTASLFHGIWPDVRVSPVDIKIYPSFRIEDRGNCNHGS